MALRNEHLAIAPAHVIVEMSVVSAWAICPTCAQPSSRVHGRYSRTLADLPWCGIPVQVHVQVRRFRCYNQLKLIKRQMYGRASFELLRQRVLHAEVA